MMEASIKLSDLQEFISCPLCHGYLIDATTVNECLHTFCKSCIIKHIKDNNNECPKCNTLIHERRPLDYIIQDRSKQDIVYKLVPQLYISELNRKYAIQGLPDIDSFTESVLKKNFIYVVLVQKRRNSPINPILSPKAEANKSASKNEIYLKCPINIRISHLRKLLVVKFQLLAHDRVAMFYKGDILSDFDHVSNLAQSLTFRLQYEISRIIKSLKPSGSTSISSFESASTSSSMNSTATTATTTTATIATSTDDSSDEMSVDDTNTND